MCSTLLTCAATWAVEHSRGQVEPVGERAERRALRSATAARARAPRLC